VPIPIEVTAFPPIIWRRVQANLASLNRRRPLNPELVQRLRGQLRVLHTHHSNAIEGNRLTLRETQIVLEEGITIGGRTLREHFETVNTAHAFDWVWEAARPKFEWDHVRLQELHEIVMRGISEFAGRYRTQNVRITGSDHAPPAPAKIVRRLDVLFDALTGIRDPLVRGVYFHHQLLHVHPFLDGNGRVARLASNLVLMSAGYPPTVLRAEDRHRYYEGLRKADSGEYPPLARLLLRSVDEALATWLAAVEPESALVALQEIARGSPYSQEYLSLRARQGVLEAVKIGGVWHSSRRALAQYLRGERKQPR
jgi:Fic family protein